MDEVNTLTTPPSEPILMDVSLAEKEEKVLNPDSSIESMDILKKELGKEEQINIINSEINYISSKISELESKTNETINSVNNIRSILGATTQLNKVESTENNTVKMLELSKNLESLIAKKNSLLLETTKVPGMAEVIETFNPEEHKN